MNDETPTGNVDALALFDALLDATAQERADAIAALRTRQPAVAAQLERWLAADAHAAGVADDAARFATLLAADPPEVSDADASPGERIGPYRLERELGRGGMGAVWLAVRDDGEFHQQVALKLIKRGMDSLAVQRRFRVERRILAQLEHPSIARLIDGGVSADGRLWFALDYVAGDALFDFARREQLDLRQRLQLFVKLCGAVAHAHAQLVVHRDLKPANILVQPDGTPKLLDFGIAKLVADDGAGDATAEEARFLTHAYAAPEQLDGRPVSTATDVYALGLILYELLAGRRSAPATGGSRQTGRPSAAREHAGAAGPDRVRAQQLRGDLDTIVLRALAPEPSRRYAGAQALADDIERYLDARPVRARPDTVRYRAGKFVRRHALPIAAAAIAAAALLVGSALAVWQAQRARVEAARAGAVTQFLQRIFESNDPANARGATISARELLDRGAARIGDEFAGDAQLAATLQHTIGRLYIKLGVIDRAQALLASADRTLPADRANAALRAQIRLDIAETAAASSATEDGFAALAATGPLAGADAVRADTLRAVLLHQRGDDAAALAAAKLAFESSRRDAGATAIATLAIADTYAELLDEAGRDREAEPLLRATLAARVATLGADDPRTLRTATALAGVQRDTDQLEAASALAADTLERRRRVLGETHPDTLRSEVLVGRLHYAAGRYTDADAQLVPTIARLRGAVPVDRNLLGTALLALATSRYFQGDIDDAERHYREALAIWTALYGPEHRDALSAEMSIAAILRRRGQLDAAIPSLRHVLAARERDARPTPELIEALRFLGDALVAHGDTTEGTALLERAVDVAVSVYGERHEMPQQTRVLLARAYLGAGRADDARRMMTAALAALQALHPDGHPDVARTQGYLARLELKTGNAAKAVEYASAQLAFVRKQFSDPTNPRVVESEALLAEARQAAAH